MQNDRRIAEGKWEPVVNIDFQRRTPEEWSKIYGIKLISTPPAATYWSEYEWAYHFPELSYYPGSQDYEKIAEMEMRAYELRRDIFWGADIGEKEVLEEKYIETRWVMDVLRMF